MCRFSALTCAFHSGSGWKSLWSPRYWSNLRVLHLLQHEVNGAVELRIGAPKHEPGIVDYFDVGLNPVTFDPPFPRLFVKAHEGNQRPPAIYKRYIYCAAASPCTHGACTDDFAEPAL